MATWCASARAREEIDRSLTTWTLTPSDNLSISPQERLAQIEIKVLQKTSKRPLLGTTRTGQPSLAPWKWEYVSYLVLDLTVSKTRGYHHDEKSPHRPHHVLVVHVGSLGIVVFSCAGLWAAKDER